MYTSAYSWTELNSRKEDVEKKLTELSEHYNEALKDMKHETAQNVAKLIETEQKCEEIETEKTKLETKTELLCAQLLESELRIKDISKKLLEMETDLRKLNIEYKSIFLGYADTVNHFILL